MPAAPSGQPKMSPGLSTAFQGADDCRLRTSALRSKGILFWFSAVLRACHLLSAPAWPGVFIVPSVETAGGVVGSTLSRLIIMEQTTHRFLPFYSLGPCGAPALCWLHLRSQTCPAGPAPGQRPLQVAETVHKVCPQHGEVRAAGSGCKTVLL